VMYILRACDFLRLLSIAEPVLVPSSAFAEQLYAGNDGLFCQNWCLEHAVRKP